MAVTVSAVSTRLASVNELRLALVRAAREHRAARVVSERCVRFSSAPTVPLMLRPPSLLCMKRLSLS